MSTTAPSSTTGSEPAVSQTIARSPADVLRLVVAAVAVLLMLLIEWLFGDALVGFVTDLLRGLSAIPQWMVDTFVIATRVIAFVVIVVGLLWTIVRSGTRMLVTVAFGMGLGVLLFLVLGDLVDVAAGATHVEVTDSLGALTNSSFPSVFWIAATTGALTAAAPWLSRRWRQWGWVAVFGLVTTRFITTPASFDSYMSALCGWLGGAGALVALGAPSRRATTRGIMDGLAAVGLPMATLEAAGVDARGSTPYFGAGPDGSRYFVKALGRDQRSADMLFRMYRALQRKDHGDERPFSSLRRTVEHEAYVSMTARDLGARTPRIRAFARTEPATFVLAYDAVQGRSLDRVSAEQITDDVLRAIWESIAQLRSHRIAHRDLRLANLFLADDGEVWMIDFGFSETAASDLLLATDVAELVASSSVVVGPERAVSHVVATVDPDTVNRAVDRLRPWALSGATRTALKQRPGLLDDLRTRLAAR